MRNPTRATKYIWDKVAKEQDFLKNDNSFEFLNFSYFQIFFKDISC